MIHYTDMTGLGSSTVAMVAAVVLLPGVRHLPRPQFAWLVCIVAIAALIPFGGLLPPAAYVRGVTGDLSITSLILLVLAILDRLSGWQPFNAPARLALLCLVTFAALGLYPMALGVGFFDPYRPGYGNPWFLGVLLAVALIAYVRQSGAIALGVAVAVLAWSAGWYESNNLWDYLLDPFVSIYALVTVTRHGYKTLFSRPEN